jgi:addiction module RelE/StbE family toxin
MKTQASPQLLEKLKKLDVRIRNNFFEKIKIFEENPQEPVLNNHALKQEYKGYRSIDITNDYRALYEEVSSGTEAITYFLLLGTHQELYVK